MGFFNKLKKKVRNKIVSPELAPFNRGRSVLTGLRNTNRRNIGSGLVFGPQVEPTKGSAPPAMDLDRIMRGPGMPMAPQAPRPIGEMPLTPEQMARKAEYERNKAIENERNVISKYGSRENMERMVRDSFAGPRGNMGSDFRMPQKPQRFTGLSSLFHRLQEQGDMGMPRIPQPIPERMPVSNAPSFNPTIFGQPIGNMDFSQMPQISPEDMRNLQIPTQMPVMPEERMAPPVMNQMQGEPRMMMSRGRDANMVDFLNSDPQQQIFGIETRIGVLENKLQEALANNDRQSYDMIVQQINDADAQRINIMNSINSIPRTQQPQQRQQQESLDDILADLEKKN